MSGVRKIRKQPLLMQIMKAAGGLHARTALQRARAAMRSARGDNVVAIAVVLARMAEWRDLPDPGLADWEALYAAGSEVISLCDPDDDAHLVRAARMLCDYIDAAPSGPRHAKVAALFINTMKAVACNDVDAAARAEVLRELEGLIRR